MKITIDIDEKTRRAAVRHKSGKTAAPYKGNHKGNYRKGTNGGKGGAHNGN